jgi:hypothetical protein
MISNEQRTTMNNCNNNEQLQQWLHANSTVFIVPKYKTSTNDPVSTVELLGYRTNLSMN